jgi:hypothetical protein
MDKLGLLLGLGQQLAHPRLVSVIVYVERFQMLIEWKSMYQALAKISILENLLFANTYHITMRLAADN